MRIVRKQEIPVDMRQDKRAVRKMLELDLDKPVSSVVFYLNDVPVGNFGKHHHSDSTEIIWFPKGGKIEVNGKVYAMQDWDGVVLDPGDVHSYDKGDCNEIIHFAIKFPAINDKVEVK